MPTSLGVGDLDLDFWWELALLVVIMLLGHWLEMKAIGQAQGALAALAELLPDVAERVTDDGVESVPLAALHPGDVVLVRSGARVPADGVIVDGEAELDESMVTGESRAVPKHVGDRVVAGTVTTDSAIRVRVEAVGDDTALAGIQRLVAEAQASRSRAQALADRAAGWLFYVAAGAGIVTFVVWMLVGDADEAVEHTVTVLVIACPHALGLAIPLVIALSTAVAARAGILVKDRLALERMREITAVLFDKTGTLTRGRTRRHRRRGRGRGRVVGRRAARARRRGRVRQRAPARPRDRDRGAWARSGARGPRLPLHHRARRRSGRRRHASSRSAVRCSSGNAASWSPTTSRRGSTAGRRAAPRCSSVVRGDAVIGALALEDEVRPESRRGDPCPARPRDPGGDDHRRRAEVAEAVARDVGVDEVLAEVLPEDKDTKVAELQARGLRVAMVGDGVNDAPALARADVGIAIGAGTDVAIESAGVVLASSDPRSVVGVITLSHASYRKMVQNLAWGAGYNVAAIPLAAGALAWAGFTLGPAVGAVPHESLHDRRRPQRAAPPPSRPAARAARSRRRATARYRGTLSSVCAASSTFLMKFGSGASTNR